MHLQGDISGFKTNFCSVHGQRMMYEMTCSVFICGYLSNLCSMCCASKEPFRHSLLRIPPWTLWSVLVIVWMKAAWMEKMGNTWVGWKPTTGSTMQGRVVGRKLFLVKPGNVEMLVLNHKLEVYGNSWTGWKVQEPKSVSALENEQCLSFHWSTAMAFLRVVICMLCFDVRLKPCSFSQCWNVSLLPVLDEDLFVRVA